MKQWLLKKPRNQLIAFFAIAFVLAWGSWIPVFMYPSLPSQITFIGLFAPALSALFVAALSGGKRAVLDILLRFKISRAGIWWYPFAVLVMPILYFIAVEININFFNYPANHIFLGSQLYFIVIAFVWLVVVNSGEEIGWRGFALPLMLKQSKSLFWTTAILGLVWGLWHLPLYVLPGVSSIPYLVFLLLTVAISFIYTFLFVKTKGSLLPVIFLHAGTDVGARIFQIAQFTPTVWITVDILIALVAWVLWAMLKTNSNNIEIGM